MLLRAGLLALALNASAALAAPAEVLKWTNPEGKVIEAEFVEMTDEHVTLKVKGQTKEMKVAHDKLSAESLDQAKSLAKEAREAGEKAALQPAMFKLGQHMIEYGKRTEVMLPIKHEESRKKLTEFYGKPTGNVKVTVVVPKGFDPTNPDSLVVICHSSTSGGKGVSSGVVRFFLQGAMESGALVLAADGEFGNPGKTDVHGFRALLVYEMLMAMMEDHPAAKWRYIHAGHSGGCGYACYMSLYMVSHGFRVAGAFLSAGNYSPVRNEDVYKLKAAEKKQLRLYYSFGRNDPVCTPALQEEVLAVIKRSPYKNHRVSYHDDKHGMWQPHFKEAMEWFKQPPEL